MSSLFDRMREIERELHTLETATPRNSATVDRGGLSVVEDGSVILEAGGTVRFDEGGSATTPTFDISSGTGWKIGTERRGSSVVVINDTPSVALDVTTANSTSVYEELQVAPREPVEVALSGATMIIVQLFHINEVKGTVLVGGESIEPSRVMKSKKEQWAYSYMGTISQDTTVQTDLEDVSVRLLRITVNNVS